MHSCITAWGVTLNFEHAGRLICLDKFAAMARRTDEEQAAVREAELARFKVGETDAWVLGSDSC